MSALMIKLLNRFAQRYQYDVGYMQEMERVSPGTLWRYFLLVPLSMHRSHLPPAHYFAAKLVATAAQDCGPCVRLVMNMAMEAGVEEQLLWHVLQNNVAQLDDGMKPIVAFAHAMIDNKPEAQALRQEVVALWGEGAIADLSLAISFGGFYPTLKRGLGHAQSCEPVFADLAKRFPGKYTQQEAS